MKSKWLFAVTRGGLVPVLITDIVVAYFYFAFILTDGKQGVPPEYACAVLIATHSLFVLVFIFELIGNIVVTTWQTVHEFIVKH